MGFVELFISSKGSDSRYCPVSRSRSTSVNAVLHVYFRFVTTDQSVALGDSVLRSYTPAKVGQKQSVINIYCCETSHVGFITDKVSACLSVCVQCTCVSVCVHKHSGFIPTRSVFVRVVYVSVCMASCGYFGFRTGKVSGVQFTSRFKVIVQQAPNLCYNKLMGKWTPKVS